MNGEGSSKHAQLYDPELWLQEHGDYLFRYALLRLHDRELAEDMVQETLLSGFRSRQDFQGRSSVRTWLVGILKHKILDHFRKSDRESPMSDLLHPEDSSEGILDDKGGWRLKPSSWADDPRAVLERREFWDAFIRCMSELPQRVARVFSLRELEGLKGEEICNVMRISSTNLGVILYRARMRLKRCLEINWFEQAPEKE